VAAPLDEAMERPWSGLAGWPVWPVGRLAAAVAVARGRARVSKDWVRARSGTFGPIRLVGVVGGGRTAHVTATSRAVELAGIAAEAAADKLASDIIAYDVSEQLVITDVFLLCSAANDRQVRAIVDEIEDKLRQAGARPVRREGEREGRWVLLDYLDIVVHVQHAEERTFYGLERLWKDCPRIELPEPVSVAGPAGAEPR
jgi:ribosome-associated protein